MSKHTCQPIVFRRVGLPWKGKIPAARLPFDVDNQSPFSASEDSLFAQNGKHEIFKPTKTYPSMTLGELAAFAPEPIA